MLYPDSRMAVIYGFEYEFEAGSAATDTCIIYHSGY